VLRQSHRQRMLPARQCAVWRQLRTALAAIVGALLQPRARLVLVGVIVLGAALFSTVATAPPLAQVYGKNKVQLRNLRWQVLSTPHFDIHYYEEAEELAVRASIIAEKAYREYSDRLDRDLPWKVPFVLYVSHADFAQTNISPYLIGEGTGGFNEPLRNRMVLPYDGTHADFVHVIRHELVHSFMFHMAFGPRADFGRRYFYQLPLWFAEGVAEWFSTGWDKDADMFIRDATINDYLYPLDRVYGFLVYKEGQAAIRMLAELYGPRKLVDFWWRIGSTRSVGRALKDIYGLSMPELNELFRREMRKRYWPSYGDLEQIGEVARPLTDHRADEAFFNGRPALSPEGDQLVYFSDRDDLIDLYLMSAIDGKIIRRLGRSQRSSRFESFHSFRSGMSFAPDGREIALVAKSGNFETLHTIDTETGRITRTLRLGFDVMSSPTWSADGESIVLVGTRLGRTDLYLLDLSGRAAARLGPGFGTAETLANGMSLLRLTDDMGDEHNPVFSPDGSRLVFSHNPLAEIEYEFAIEADGRRRLLWARPHGPQSAGFDRVAAGGCIVVLDLETGLRHEVCGRDAGWRDPVWIDERTLAVVADAGGIDNLAIVHLDETGTQVISSRLLTSVLGGIRHLTYSSRADRLVFSAFHAAGYDLYAADAFAVQWSLREPAGQVPAPVVLEPPAMVKRTTPPEALIDRDGVGLVRDYHPRLTIDMSEALAGGSIYFTSAGGFGMVNVLTLTDLMGDHKIRLLLNFYGSFSNSDLSASYYYLKRRLDVGFGIFSYHNFLNSGLTTVGELIIGDSAFQERNYGLFGWASYPLSTFQRIDFELQSFVSERTQFALNEDFIYIEQGVQTSRLIQPSISFVQDTALFGTHGPVAGSRWSLSFARSVPVSRSSVDRFTMVADVRKYWLPWARNTFATHLSVALSGGDNPRAFVLGGPWTLRGYDYYDYRRLANLAGSKLFLWSFEYRLPLVDYLILGWPLAWGVNDLGAVVFFDMGCAWNDRVTFFGKDDAGHWGFADLRGDIGFGIRTNVFILPLRLDWAWRTDLRRVDGMMFHFSIGPNF